MGAMDPYYQHLHQLASTWLGQHQQPRIEPTFPPLDPNEMRDKKRNPVARQAGESAVDTAMDQAMTDQWKQRMKEAKDATPQGKSRAFVNKMRAAREGQKAVGKELAKPPGEEAKSAPSLLDQIETQRENQMRSFPGFESIDPRAGPAGEDAVRKAMLNTNMGPLIDQTLQEQIRQFIQSQIPPHWAPVPESYIPENSNYAKPGDPSYTTQIMNPDKLWKSQTTPGVAGTPQVIDPLRSSGWGSLPPPANMPLFPPPRPPDPNLPQGPHVRSPGKPEVDEPPVE